LGIFFVFSVIVTQSIFESSRLFIVYTHLPTFTGGLGS
jgi:hypothetical protein